MKAHVLRKALAAGLTAFVLMAAASASSALADAQYVLDPQHSLTAGCATDEVDPVADPSCPYEAFPAGPSEPFVSPQGMAIDTYGNLYVVVRGPNGPTNHAHIDVFDPDGHFITEVAVPSEPRTVAVDSKGHLYVYSSTEYLERYDVTPGSYDPANGQIAYESTPTAISFLPPNAGGSFEAALAINPQNDHLFVDLGFASFAFAEKVLAAVFEIGSAEEGNPVLDKEVAEADARFSTVGGLAIDASRGRLYAVDREAVPGEIGPRLVSVFELAAPHHLIETLDGSSLPDGTFVKCGFEPENCGRRVSLTVDEGTGNLFVYDYERRNLIYELTGEGQYLASIDGDLSNKSSAPQVLVDNGDESPNGALRAEGRYLWATAAPNGLGHAFAFAPRKECPPVVESTSFAHVGEAEALLRAQVEPCQVETSYRFEYVSAQQFAESEFAGAKVAGEGTIESGGKPVAVSAGATGLAAGAEYVFRVVAENDLGKDEGQGSFKTYPTTGTSGPCSNEALRSGPSALLPDCRAYELVTPANTNGLPPFGIGDFGQLFLSRVASPDGEKVTFRIEGGILPGTEGTGSLNGDPYLATRGPNGWAAAEAGGKGREFIGVETGGHSPDQAYSVWRGSVQGSAANYLRFPDGHSEPMAQGSLATDPDAIPLWISENGEHTIFFSPLRLEEEAVAGGAIYDRTADGVTHVLSLLPGGAPVVVAGFGFRGSSQDGRGVAFAVGNKLYFHYNDETTFELGENLTYEGIAEGGKRVFYLKGGKLFAFDTEAGTIPFTSAGEATVVSVASDGTAAYVASTTKLTSAANPLGQKAKAGQQNLYLSREGQVSFVATVTERDMVGETNSTLDRDGLGLWAKYVDGKATGALPSDPSRTTSDGEVFVFSSRSSLTSYDNAGQPELYRYDAAANTLQCASCHPTGQPASSGAVLQLIRNQVYDTQTFRNDRVENLSQDGGRLFFETTEALVAADIDGLRDVYEWEAEGEGSCTAPEGCVYLISSGRSTQDDFLYGVSASGDDVFIASNDLLDPTHDPDETRSIYDARVNGGFGSTTQPAECLGEACQPAAKPPERPAQLLQGAGNVQQEAKAARCPKGKRAVKTRGKTRCVRRHTHQQRKRTPAKHGRSHR